MIDFTDTRILKTDLYFNLNFHNTWVVERSFLSIHNLGLMHDPLYLIWQILGVFIYIVDLVIKVISKILIPSASKFDVQKSFDSKKSFELDFEIQGQK